MGTAVPVYWETDQEALQPPGSLRPEGLGSEPGRAAGTAPGARQGLAAPGTATWNGSHYLDVPVQQLLGEALQGHGGVLRAVGLPVEEGDVGGVTGERLGVAVLKGFEVVVDGVSHHNLPCEYLQDLETAWKRG